MKVGDLVVFAPDGRRATPVCDYNDYVGVVLSIRKPDRSECPATLGVASVIWHGDSIPMENYKKDLKVLDFQ